MEDYYRKKQIQECEDAYAAAEKDYLFVDQFREDALPYMTDLFLMNTGRKQKAPYFNKSIVGGNES